MRISDWSSDVCSSDLTTTSNAWGTIAVRKFAQSYPATAITGTTTLALGARSVSRAWPLAADQRAISLPLPPAQTPLMLRQTGGEGPWATVSVSAAVPLTRPLAAGYQAKSKVSVVSQRQKGVLTRGEGHKVKIRVER